jgi:hypothetical protein
MTSERPAHQAKSASPPPADSFSLLFHNHPGALKEKGAV